MKCKLSRVIADECKLKQVIINLAGNALKFTSVGGVTLHFSARVPSDAKGITLIIEVEDTGKGIANVDKERIFEPFVQLGSKSSQEGTGLGLAITRQFVHLMGGKISVESELEKGSKFRVEIPVKQAGSEDITLITVNENSILRLTPGQPEFRILIVEDKPENYQLMRSLMESSGFQVRIAKNGAEGVDIFKSWRPHFIWMDWRMPIMDGLEATRIIRTLEGGSDVKIIALSASVLKEDRTNILAAGVNGFVSKPIKFSTLYDCMVKHLKVRFVSPTGAAQGATVKSSEDMDLAMKFSELPPLLLDELQNALLNLNAAQINESICRIAESNQELGSVLKKRADRFQYSSIMCALKSCRGTTNE